MAVIDHTLMSVWNEQGLAVVEIPVFRNCLIAMRPRTMPKDLPSKHAVGVYIHNEFVGWLKKIKGEIMVSDNCIHLMGFPIVLDRMRLEKSRRRQTDGPPTTQKRRFWE